MIPPRDIQRDLQKLYRLIFAGFTVDPQPVDIYLKMKELCREDILTFIRYPGTGGGWDREALKYAEELVSKHLPPFLKSGHIYKYPKADHTVDAVVFGVDIDAKDLKVLLIERGREGEPFFGCWALPGGFINHGEDLVDAFHRELEEETELRVSYTEQLYTFGTPGRDPRGRVISTAYLALVRPIQVKGQDDAAKAEWWPIKKLPHLAFDHREIMEMGLERLRSKLRWQPVGIDLLPEKFTLPCLQQVYEIILGRKLDKRNFRRSAMKLGVLKDCGETTVRGHPTKLYRFDRREYRRLQKDGVFFEI